MTSCHDNCTLPAFHYLHDGKCVRLWAHDFARAHFFGDANRGYVSAQGKVTKKQATTTQQYIQRAASTSARCQLMMRDHSGTIGTGSALCKQLLPNELNELIHRQWGRFNPRSQKIRDVYRALIPYVNVIVNEYVKVCSVKVSGDRSGWGLGVVAKKPIPADYPLEVLSGFFVPINAEQSERLYLHDMDHSTVEAYRYDTSPEKRNFIPASNNNRKRRFAAAELYQSTALPGPNLNGNRECILVGPIAFVNHSCQVHSNCFPHLLLQRTLFERVNASDDDNPNLRSIHEWKAVLTRRRIPAGMQLEVEYADYQREADGLLNKKRLTKAEHKRLDRVCELATQLTCPHC